MRNGEDTIIWEIDVERNKQQTEKREERSPRLQRISEADEASLGWLVAQSVQRISARTRSEPSGGKYFELRSVPSGERGGGGGRGGVRGRGSGRVLEWGAYRLSSDYYRRR
jgi:hypothetical protein